jgi:hypothetical protein
MHVSNTEARNLLGSRVPASTCGGSEAAEPNRPCQLADEFQGLKKMAKRRWKRANM